MAYKTITPQSLIEKFKYALDNKWGYILNKAGVLWTQKMQNETTNEQAKLYGQQWVGRYVADCSGLFSWAFSKLGSYMYHGSNTMWKKYCVAQGDLRNGKRTDGEVLKPGTAVFTDHDGDKTHVGLYVGDGEVIEASGTRSGVITTRITNTKWKCWGELKYVDYSGTAKETDSSTTTSYPTLRYGSKGDLVFQMQRMLNQLGSNLTADGIFGNGTRSAVVAFQRKNGLEADGICGSKTWKKLLEMAANIKPAEPAKYTVTITGLTKTKANEIIGKYGGKITE